MYGVAIPLGFEKLPHGLHPHELRGLMLQFFQLMKQVERLRFVLAETLLEVTLITYVLSVEHVRVDVTPDFGEMRHIAHLTVRIGRDVPRSEEHTSELQSPMDIVCRP